MLVNGTGAALYVHSLGVNLVNFIHALGIQQNAAANRQSAALRAAAGTPNRYGNFVVVCNFNNLRNLFGIFRAYNIIGLRHHAAAVCPHSGKPVVVYTVRNLVNFLNRTVFLTYGVFKLG